MSQSQTTANTLAATLDRRTRDRGHHPLLTVYDDLVDARTELSYATADNWASKTANLLVEELALQPGDTVALDVAGHWTAAVITLACWKAGLAVADRGASVPADLWCCHVSRLRAHPTGPVLAVGDGLRAEPRAPVAPRPGLVLLGEEVHMFADDHDDADVDAASPALVIGSSVLDHAAVLSRAARVHDAVGDGARIGVAATLDGAPAIVLLAGALVAGGSLVADRPVPHVPRWDRWRTERVSAVAGAADAPHAVPDPVADDAPDDAPVTTRETDGTSAPGSDVPATQTHGPVAIELDVGPHVTERGTTAGGGAADRIVVRRISPS